MEYYDRILAGMLGSLVLGALFSLATALPANYGIGTGAALAMGFMYHGMFRNAPVMGQRPR